MDMEFNNDINYLDQHFLVDKSVINAFVDAADLKVTEDVIEIGPGKTLTGFLKKINRNVKALHVEKTEDLDEVRKECL